MLEDANQGNLIKLAYMLARLNIRWNVSFMVEKKNHSPPQNFFAKCRKQHDATKCELGILTSLM